MTICIVAICTMDDDCSELFPYISGQEVIIGISDRMVSTETTQAEVPIPKYSKVIGSIVVSPSGDIPALDEIIQNTKSFIWKDFNNNPRTIPVIDVAELYSQNIRSYTREQKDNVTGYYAGINYKEFKKLGRGCDDYEKTKTQLTEIYKVWAIVSGIDATGAHVYYINYDGSIRYQDKYGISIIGSGKWHAENAILRVEHTRKVSFKNTLCRLYKAKKCAEYDPNVGKETDVFMISTDHSVNIFSEDAINILDEMYNDLWEKEKEAIREAGGKMASFLRKNGKMKLI